MSEPQKDSQTGVDALAEGYNTAQIDKLQDTARQYGITDEVFAQRHPDIARAEQEQADKVKGVVPKIFWTSGITGAALAALPLIFPKAVKNPVVRVLVAAASGLGGLFIGGAAAAFALLPSSKKANEISDKHELALVHDIMQAQAAQSNRLPAPEAKSASVTVETPAKEFTATITQRDASQTAQVAKEAAQPSTPAVSA